MNRDSFDIAKAFVNQVLTVLATGQAHWRKACMMSRRWRVSDNESRRVMSEGEGACSPLFDVRSHLPLRGKLGWMTPRVGVKTTLTNGNALLGALVPKQGPHFFAPNCSAGRSPRSPAAFLIRGNPFLTVLVVLRLLQKTAA